MADLPQPAVEHLYPFLVLAVVLVGLLLALLGGILSVLIKGRKELRGFIRSELRYSYTDDEEGKPGIAAVMTQRIVERAFASNLDHITKALRDVEAVQQAQAQDLKDHERREFDRGDKRDRDLKADVARTIETALRYPRELATQYQIVRATVDEHGKQLDAHEHRLRVLEAK